MGTKTSNQLNKVVSRSFIICITLSLLFMSLGGLPPLTGFIPKLIIIDLICQYRLFIVLFLIIGSLLNLFFYLNIAFNLILSRQVTDSPSQQKVSISFLPMLRLSSLGAFIIVPYAMTLFN